MPCPLVSDSLLIRGGGRCLCSFPLKSGVWGFLGKMVEVMLCQTQVAVRNGSFPLPIKWVAYTLELNHHAVMKPTSSMEGPCGRGTEALTPTELMDPPVPLELPQLTSWSKTVLFPMSSCLTCRSVCSCFKPTNLGVICYTVTAN